MNGRGPLPVLDLVGGLIEDERRYGTPAGRAPFVIPVVHESFAADRPLLEAAFHHVGGILLVADPRLTAVAGNPSAELVDVVRAACARYPQLDIRIEVRDGRVQVSSETQATNESHLVVLSAIALLLSEDAASSSLVAIAYNTDGFDRLRARLMWELALYQVPEYLPRRVRVFVPIVAGETDVRLHCVGDRSARWVLRSDVLHRRRVDPGALNSAVARIAGNLDRPLVLFLGAGASASSRIPQGDGVRDEAIQRLLGAETRPPDIESAFWLWVNEEGRRLADEDDMDESAFLAVLTLERVLHEEFRDLLRDGRARVDSPTVRQLREASDRALERLPPGRLALRRLLAEHPRLVVATVNVDQQIEHDLDIPHVVYAVPSEFDAAAGHVRDFLNGDASHGVPILKIHGTITDPDSLIFDLEQTVSGLHPYTRAALEQVFSTGPVDWVWIGCSMRDRDVTQWMRSKDAGRDLAEWFVDPLPGPGIERFVRDTRDAEAQLRLRERLITETSDVFLAALADRVSGLRRAPDE